MKKWIFSAALVFGLSLTNTNTQNMMEHGHNLAPRAFKPSSAQYVHPDSVVTGHLSVKGMKLTGFAGTDLKKMQDAFAVLEQVVNSAEFKNKVINFKNTKGERKFASNNGLSNEEIFEQFMEGRETLQTNTPGEMNFFLKLYNNRWSRVVGWTTPDTNQININRKFFRNYKANEVAGNLAHEWTHKLGFGHASAAEHDSVPYAVGYIVEEMAAKLITSPTQKVALR
ncbi:MAG TPA: hypothetical protein VNJ08_03145 [Bacteriovoracaceae bacterium]|nr:hypothetical protein [Bacteriovoracaceae bacterium]